MDIEKRVSILPLSIPEYVKKIICVGSGSWKHVKCVRKIENTYSYVIDEINWHPSGRKFATCLNDDGINIWNTNGTVLHTIQNEHTENTDRFAWHPNGTKFVTCTCCKSHFIHIWKEDGTLLHTIPNAHRETY